MQRAGHTGALQAMLALQNRRYSTGTQSAFEIAETETLLGNDSSAVAHLRMAYVAHDPLMISLRTNELLRPLHHDPKFRQLLADMGLPPLD
jgi:hypothetical protein